MHFKKLRLHGFKSFVEPTELVIGAGMTGIIGPNGCGKSNLVEALRWVMGETSPKRMRGTEMNDVIFGGTTTRSARNVAEVTLELDNSQRTATAEFNNSDDIVITRQIERDSGSDYRLNGRPVRQRDVQLVFADLATGAHSTSLVGQGQIDALIRSKPQERRQILEEASGTAGLHARRHEAELKLKGAEQNLTRVDDVLNALDTQLRSLKTQVRQASRYRNLADHIRRTEAALFHLRWIAGKQQAEDTRIALDQADRAVSELMSVVTRGTTARTEAAAELPALRQTEAAAAAVVQRLVIAREQLDGEAQRLTAEMTAQEQRLTQAKSDHARELALSADAGTAIERLTQESDRTAARLAELTESQPTAQTALTIISAEVTALDTALNDLMEQVAIAEAKRNALKREYDELSQRRTSMFTRREDLERQRTTLIAENAARPDLALAQAMLDACETDLARRQQQIETTEQARRDAELAQQTARETLRTAESQRTRLHAEAEAIKALLADSGHDGETLVDLITVEPGLESALAAALGEALTAPLDPTAALHWRALPAYAEPQALPQGVASLDMHIKAPSTLARCLSQVGLVADTAQGHARAAELKPGQILVSRDGWAWRWDGFTVTPDAPTASALRLKQRNRLTALSEELAAAEAELQAAQQAMSATETAYQAKRGEETAARNAVQQAFAALNDARRNHAKIAEARAAADSKLAALEETLAHLDNDLRQITERHAAAETELAQMPDTAAMRNDVNARRATLAEKRQAQAAQQSAFDQIEREQKSLTQRQSAIAQEIDSWRKRADSATTQLATLTARATELEASLAQLRELPDDIKARRDNLMTRLTQAEADRAQASDRLIEAETKLAEIERQLKADETALVEAREHRVRSEAAVQAADEHLRELRERIVEKLDCAPDQTLEIAQIGEGEIMPSLADLDQQLARYLRERDTMGPVNLRAEVESDNVQTEITKLQTEKEDLVAAIAKLRQGIGQLNREARDRLQDAFSKVDERFRTLFARLFNGGRAHLELIDDEDPMNAGLEIYASPPGKKLQVLSLLSGGERTLTALALLFAVFQTNPSPICVLDEAEAALDESNVDRFCSLVEDIARETSTRFLVITHQRLTMARMDRLFGVTMSEKGVSQLVSVNLAQAEAIRDGEVPEGLTAAA